MSGDIGRRHRPRFPIRTVVVALLLVFAGCAGALSNPGQNDTDQPGDAAGDTGPLAPGLSDDGVDNVSLLAERHFDILENESGDGTYIARTSSNTTTNGTLLEESWGHHVVAYPERRYSTKTTKDYTGDSAEMTVSEEWFTENDTLERFNSTDRSPTYRSHDSSEQPGHPLVLEEQVTGILGTVSTNHDDVTVAEQTRDGTTWYVVTREWEVESPDDVSSAVTVHIREDGFIKRADDTLVTERAGGETKISPWHLEFEITLNTALEQPDWYEKALESAPDE